MAWSMSLPCGISSIMAYTYPFYLTVLLLHRCHRDEKRCQKKYGPLWTLYTQQVPYRMVPYVY
jgi:7-dehydrocholesterol reductase